MKLRKSKAAVIMGGGVELPADMEQVPDGVDGISVNHHAAMNYDCRCIVYNDQDAPTSDGWPQDVPTVARFEDATVQYPFPKGQQSAICALTWALNQGYEAILLAGFDLYVSRTYYYRRNEQVVVPKKSVQALMSEWPARGKVRAISGPLTRIYGKFDPDQHAIFGATVRVARPALVRLDAFRTIRYRVGLQRLGFEPLEAAKAAGILEGD